MSTLIIVQGDKLKEGNYLKVKVLKKKGGPLGTF